VLSRGYIASTAQHKVVSVF